MMHSNSFKLVLGLLIAVGIWLQIQFLILKDTLTGLGFLAGSLASVILTYYIWIRYGAKLTPNIINFLIHNIVGQKVISGSNKIYFEEQKSKIEVKPFDPISKFVSLLISFLALATTLLKLVERIFPVIKPANPFENIGTSIGWVATVIVVPLLLTLIIPVVWTLEDLSVKAYNSKKMTVWMVADKYRVKFNSFIAISAITAGMSLTGNKNSTFLDNLIVFLNLLLNGIYILVLPLSLIILVYYFKFKAESQEGIKKLIHIPTSRTYVEEIVSAKAEVTSNEVESQSQTDENSKNGDHASKESVSLSSEEPQSETKKKENSTSEREE